MLRSVIINCCGGTYPMKRLLAVAALSGLTACSAAYNPLYPPTKTAEGLPASYGCHDAKRTAEDFNRANMQADFVFDSPDYGRVVVWTDKTKRSNTVAVVAEKGNEMCILVGGKNLRHFLNNRPVASAN